VSIAPALIIVATQLAAGADSPTGLPLSGEEAERFLRTAEVVALIELDTDGVSGARRATLRVGDQSHDAIFKTIDAVLLKEKLPRGRTLLQLEDSYRHEIAAYELDKLLGLGLVPPTVERSIGGETGSLGLWVRGAISEWQRSEVRRLDPPDPASFNDQRQSIRLFRQLIWDADHNNSSNILIDASWRLYSIDASRAFHTEADLRRPGELLRFSRAFIDGLEALTRERLDEAMAPWLDQRQRDSLWMRRNAILVLARERVAEHGEAAVLYP
jgi:hypothetical protein